MTLFFRAFEVIFREAKDARALLRAVHLRARFPLLPYFYWFAVDPTPKAHLVIPIWSTTSDVVSVPRRDGRQRGALNLSEKATSRRKTNIVGVATAGVIPILGADPTVRSTRADKDVAAERLERIRAFYGLLARPVVDLFFYRRLKKKENLAYREAEAGVLADVSHRLRNLVAGLEGALADTRVGQLIEKKPPEALIDGLIVNVRQSLQAFGRYVERLEKLGSFDLPTDFDLGEFVDSFAITLERDYEIETIVKVAPDYLTMIHGRRDSLWWAFDELAYNALKFMPRTEGGQPHLIITVGLSPETQRVRGRGKHDWAYVELTDNGIAISEAIALKAFEKGFSTTGGSGYGLPRVKRIVEGEFDGRVSIQGLPGIGTMVKLEVPAILVRRKNNDGSQRVGGR